VAVVFLAAVAVAGFTVATLKAERDETEWRLGAVSAGIICAVLAGLGLALAVGLAQRTCDESCSGGGWWDTDDAWQWTGQLVLAACACAAAVASLALVVIRRYRAGAVAMGGSAALFAGFTVLIWPVSG
jgi:hypothetical protein